MSQQTEIPKKQCPSCKTELAENAVLCVNCGFNFKTNRQMSTQTGEALPTPGRFAAGLAFEPLSLMARIGGILHSKVTFLVCMIFLFGGGCYYCKNTVSVGIAEPVYALTLFQGVQSPPYSKEFIKQNPLPPDCMVLGGEDEVVLMHRARAVGGNYLLVPVRMSIAWSVANKLDGRYHGFLNSRDFELCAGPLSLHPVILYQRLPARFSMDMLAARRELSRFAGYVDNEKAAFTYHGDLFYLKNFQPGIADPTAFSNGGNMILSASAVKNSEIILKYQAAAPESAQEVALANIKLTGTPPFSDFKFNNCTEVKKNGAICYSAATGNVSPQISLNLTLRYVIEGLWRMECESKSGCESWLGGDKFENDKGYMPQPIDVCLLFPMPSPADKPYTLKMYNTTIATLSN